MFKELTIVFFFQNKFSPGEPNNDDSEDCLELRSEHSWTWNDESCGQNRPFICELHGILTISKALFNSYT